jgi:hypothetical protein
MRSIALLASTAIGCGYPRFEFSSPLDAAPDILDVEAGDAAVDVDDIADALETLGPFDADSGTDVEAPVTSPCTRAHLICDDFDRSGSIEARIGAVYTAGDASGGFDTARFRTSPRAFRAELRSAGNGDHGYSLVNYRELASATDGVRIEASLYFEPPPSGGKFRVMGHTRDGAPREGVAVLLVATGLELRAGAEEPYRTVAVPLQPRTWVRVTLDAVVHPTKGSFTLAIDGTEVGAARDLATGKVDDRSRETYFGLEAEAAGPGARIFIDDVTLDLL